MPGDRDERERELDRADADRLEALERAWFELEDLEGAIERFIRAPS